MPRPLEERFNPAIKDLISKYRIPPFKPIPGWEHGGPREPHVHLGNEVYLLTKAQWNEFSSLVIEKNQSLFGRARSVSFEKMGEILSKPGNLELLK